MTKLRVIFVHGMAMHPLATETGEVTYYRKLQSAIERQLERRGVIPKGATRTADGVEGIVTFDKVDYSSFGHAEEVRVINAYREGRRKLFNIVDKALDLAFEQARLQLVMSFADVLVYRSDLWRDEIRGVLLEKINPHIEEGEAVSIVAHSLGSAVAFDTVYCNSNRGTWKAAGFMPTNLFTMGSPIALFTMDPRPTATCADDEMLDDSPGGDGERGAAPPPWQEVLRDNQTVGGEEGDAQRERPEEDESSADDPGEGVGVAPAGTAGNTTLEILRANGVFYNFLDAQDLIAYPIASYFEGVSYGVKDIAVGNGVNPITAHSDYWENKEVAREIAARLEIDFRGEGA